MASFRFTAIAGVLSVSLAARSEAQVTQRVSVSTSGAAGFGNSGDYFLPSAISSDGRYVAFVAYGSNLVPGDTNGVSDVLVRDRQSGTTERVSVGPGGAEADNDSFSASISADGRYVAFVSGGTGLVAGDANGFFDVFVRDRQNGTTARVSVSSGGIEGNGDCIEAAISADGRYVAFRSFASNLVLGDTNASQDIFVHDRQNGTTERISVDSAGTQGNGACTSLPAISADGRYVAFRSESTNLVAGDTNGWDDIFLRDRQGGTTERINLGSGGAQANAGGAAYPSISADGRYVAFDSDADNLVAGDTPGTLDVFVRDRQNATTERVSVDSGGAPANTSSFFPSISADGRYVAFESPASNLVAGDTNATSDIFVRDRVIGTTGRVSVASRGSQGDCANFYPVISGDGRFIVFHGCATNLDPSDANGWWDVFLRDRLGAPNFMSLCDPGVGGVIACPCSNPPSGPGRGCDNSSATGGAILSASGGSYVSSDSLVFTTSGQRPTALSIVSQWTAGHATGIVFGMGVRCASGTLKRMYTKNAVAGSIVAPNFAVGDPTVSARSSTLGNPILAGESRWYLVYYRDPNVLGGCPASGTFNATQTGQVTWAP